MCLDACIPFLNGKTWLYVSPLVKLINKTCKRRIALNINKNPMSDSYSLVKPGQQCYKIFFFTVGFFEVVSYLIAVSGVSYYAFMQ